LIINTLEREDFYRLKKVKDNKMKTIHENNEKHRAYLAKLESQGLTPVEKGEESSDDNDLF
jgi:hypothetical protein